MPNGRNAIGVALRDALSGFGTAYGQGLAREKSDQDLQNLLNAQDSVTIPNTNTQTVMGQNGATMGVCNPSAPQSVTGQVPRPVFDRQNIPALVNLMRNNPNAIN